MQAYIYGDSIMRGVVLDENTNKYFTMSADNLSQISDMFSVELCNKSRFGCTIEKGVNLISKALDSGLTCDYMLLEYGGNDSSFNWKEVSQTPEAQHLPLTSLKTFEKALQQIVEKLKKVNIKPILMTLPPIDPLKYFSWITKDGLSKDNILKWLGDTFMIYRYHERYSNIITKIANDTKSLCVDVRSAFLERHDFDNLLCSDGIHPNINGHEIIKNCFVDFLLKNSR